jgi:surfactin synthase thioesterase subunit
MREETRSVQVPIPYLQAKHDRLVKERCFEEIQRLKQDTVLASIPAPHFVLQREPQKAVDLIVNFVQGLARAEAAAHSANAKLSIRWPPSPT